MLAFSVRPLPSAAGTLLDSVRVVHRSRSEIGTGGIHTDSRRLPSFPSAHKVPLRCGRHFLRYRISILVKTMTPQGAFEMRRVLRTHLDRRG